MGIVLSLMVAGLMIGTLYGLLGFTVTLTFRSTGVLSFASAGFALVGSYVYAGLSCRMGSRGNCSVGEAFLAPWAAMVVSVLVATAVALIVERLVIRPLQDASAAKQSIATAAVLSLCSGVMLQIYGPAPRSVPDAQQLVPTGGFTVFDVYITWQYAAIFVVSVALVSVLSLALRKTWFGLGVRAAGQLPEIARLVGVDPSAVSRFNWALAGALSGLAGVLIAPITLVNIGTFSFFLVKAVGATLIGGLASLPLTFVGGVAIGLVESLLPHFWKVSGSGEVGIAALVLGFLYFNRNRLSVRPGHAGADLNPGRVALGSARTLVGIERMLRRVPRPLGVLVGIGVVAFALGNDYYSAVGVNVLYWTLLALSLFVITGLVGQPSLMQVAFVGIGAFSVGTALYHGLPFPVGVLIGVSICAVTGLLVGYVSLRFRGLEFAIVSLTLGAAISGAVFSRPELSSRISAPTFFGLDLLRSRNVLLVMGALTILAFVGVHNVRRCGWGRSLRAVEEGQDSLLRHLGVNTTAAEIVLFAISGAIAGLAGGVYALIVNLFGSFDFIPLFSIAALLAGFVGGLRSLWGPLIAGILFGYGPYLIENLSPDAVNAYPQIASSLLALILVVHCPSGVASLFDWARDVVSGHAVERPRTFRGRPMGLEGWTVLPARALDRPEEGPPKRLRRPERSRLRRSSQVPVG